MSVMSPIGPPPSASNMQPATPIDHTEKNVSVSTPTDIHDPNNTPASPYVKAQQIDNTMGPCSTNSIGISSGADPGGGAIDTGDGENSAQIVSSTLSKSESADQNNSNKDVIIKTEPANNNDIANINNKINDNSVNVNNSKSTSNSNNSNIRGSNLIICNAKPILNNKINIVSTLKRPVLCSRDYENMIDDEFLPRQRLYDYSTLTAW